MQRHGNEFEGDKGQEQLRRDNRRPKNLLEGDAMRTRIIALAVLASATLLISAMARADAEASMSDCSEIHEIIYDLSPAELVPICRAVIGTIGIFGGPKSSDFKYLVDCTEAMSKVAGYKRGHYEQIISEAQIIKLCGQAQKPDCWPYTADIVFKTYRRRDAAQKIPSWRSRRANRRGGRMMRSTMLGLKGRQGGLRARAGVRCGKIPGLSTGVPKADYPVRVCGFKCNTA
jgi:hypothetical protein